MQLDPSMRKRVNILFVVLASASVVYGLILKYSPANNPIVMDQDSSNTEEIVEYDDGIVDLGAITTGNPD